CLVYLIAVASVLRGSPEPDHRRTAHHLELLVRASPDEVGILRANRLGEVIREERRMLLLGPVLLLQPDAERGMEPAPARLRDARVGHLARECVLDRILPFSHHRRAAAAPDEVPLLEQIEVRGTPAEEVDYRARPERAPDHRGSL